jgi:hypothetical protein
MYRQNLRNGMGFDEVLLKISGHILQGVETTTVNYDF